MTTNKKPMRANAKIQEAARRKAAKKEGFDYSKLTPYKKLPREDQSALAVLVDSISGVSVYARDVSLLRNFDWPLKLSKELTADARYEELIARLKAAGCKGQGRGKWLRNSNFGPYEEGNDPWIYFYVKVEEDGEKIEYDCAIYREEGKWWLTC